MNIYELLKDHSTMERIMKIIQNIWNGTVNFINNPNNGELACKIGDSWFYFMDEENGKLTPEQLRYKFNIFELGYMVLEAIIELDDDEYNYYCNILNF